MRSYKPDNKVKTTEHDPRLERAAAAAAAAAAASGDNDAVRDRSAV